MTQDACRAEWLSDWLRARALRLPLPRTLAIALVAGACGTIEPTRSAQEVVATANQLLTVAVGQSVMVQLSTLGGGEYGSPPVLSGSAVRFDSVSIALPAVPSGPTQQFRFTAVARGTSVVRFHHTVQSVDVSDTIVVR